MWKMIKLPYIFDRMIGFSIPIDYEIAVISYEGIHIIDLNQREPLVNHNSDHPEGVPFYDTKDQTLSYKGKRYSILGLYGGTPKLKSNSNEQLKLNWQKEEFLLLNEEAEEVFSYNYKDLSGDWAHVTFSTDDRFIVLGIPYDLYLFERSNNV